MVSVCISLRMRKVAQVDRLKSLFRFPKYFLGPKNIQYTFAYVYLLRRILYFEKGRKNN